MKRIVLWTLMLSTLLAVLTTTAFAADVENAWDTIHKSLQLRGDLGEADYALVAIYDDEGRMVKAELCTKEQIAEGYQLQDEDVDLTETCAKVFLVEAVDETETVSFRPVAEPQMPKGDKDYTQRTCVNGWLVATEDGYLMGDGPAEAGELRVSDGQREFILSAKEWKLTKDDLGTAFRIEYLADTGEVLSAAIADTSIPETLEVRAMECEVNYNTSSNQAIKKYVFTVGSLGKMTFDGDIIPMLKLTTEVDEPVDLKAEAFYDMVDNGKGSPNRYTVIDREGDGDIDWMLYVPVEYGRITRDGAHAKYGDYITMEDSGGNVVKVDGNSRLYLEDIIDTSEELQEDDIVKYYWNASLKRLTVEKLDILFDVEYTKHQYAQGIYTLGGVDYILAENCFDNVKKALGESSLGWEFDIVADGNMLVWVSRWENVQEMTEHLAVLIGAEERVDGKETANCVKLLYSDGTIDWAIYDQETAAAKNSDKADVYLTWEELKPDQLVILHETDAGVWLEAIPADTSLSIDPMQAVVDEVQSLNGTLMVIEDTVTLAKTNIDADAKLFAQMDGEYLVITPEELSDGNYLKAELTALKKLDTKTGSIVGGFLKLDTANYKAIEGYLFVTESYRVSIQGNYAAVKESYKNKTMDVLLDPAGVTKPEVHGIYAYQTTQKGSYLLEALKETAAGTLACDKDGNLYYDVDGVQTMLNMSEYDILTYWESAYSKKEEEMVTKYYFSDEEEIMEMVAEYLEERTYLFTAYQNPANEETILVVSMVEPIELLDASELYADGSTIDPAAVDAVELMYALELMLGDGKNFHPESTVTRAELAKIMYVILNYGGDDKAFQYVGAPMFSDVMEGAWYEGYVNYCGMTKLAMEREDGTFGPNESISCAEAARYLLVAIGYSPEARGYNGADWDKNVLSDAAIIGMLDDYKDNTNASVQRQWLAKLLENALTEAYVALKGDKLEFVTFGEEYYDLTKDCYIWKTVYGQ